MSRDGGSIKLELIAVKPLHASRPLEQRKILIVFVVVVVSVGSCCVATK